MQKYLRQSVTTGDVWIPTQEADGTRDYLQIGDIFVHWAGKSHSKYYGFPHWAHDDVVEWVKHWVCVATPKPEPEPEVIEEEKKEEEVSNVLYSAGAFGDAGDKDTMNAALSTGLPLLL